MPTISTTNTVGAIINTVCLLGIVASSSSREEIGDTASDGIIGVATTISFTTIAAQIYSLVRDVGNRRRKGRG